MKKLALALVAFMAVGASAQTRHYVTKDGIVHIHRPEVYQTRVVEVTPVQVVPVAPTRVILTPEATTVTTTRTLLLENDTADVPLIYPNAELSPAEYDYVIHRTVEVRSGDDQ